MLQIVFGATPGDSKVRAGRKRHGGRGKLNVKCSSKVRSSHKNKRYHAQDYPKDDQAGNDSRWTHARSTSSKGPSETSNSPDSVLRHEPLPRDGQWLRRCLKHKHRILSHSQSPNLRTMQPTLPAQLWASLQIHFTQFCGSSCYRRQFLPNPPVPEFKLPGHTRYLVQRWKFSIHNPAEEPEMSLQFRGYGNVKGPTVWRLKLCPIRHTKDREKDAMARHILRAASPMASSRVPALKPTHAPANKELPSWEVELIAYV